MECIEEAGLVSESCCDCDAEFATAFGLDAIRRLLMEVVMSSTSASYAFSSEVGLQTDSTLSTILSAYTMLISSSNSFW